MTPLKSSPTARAAKPHFTGCKNLLNSLHSLSISNMKKDFLGNLLDSPARAKIVRLFAFNQEECYTPDEVSKKAQAAKSVVQKEIKQLEKAGLIKKKQCIKEVMQGRGKKKTLKKKKMSGWAVQERSPYLQSLVVFMRAVAPDVKDGVAGKLQGAGNIRVIALAGKLCEDENSRVDLLVVGDNIDEKKLQAALRSIEADLGTEVRYAAFKTDEFQYRLNIYDKLIRDIFEYPHEILLDKLDMTTLLKK
jgi:predicted transcriptional regulator